MSIMTSIKQLKKAINSIRTQIAKEKQSFIDYKLAVENYKYLCKHAATKTDLESAIETISGAWHTHQRVKKNVDQRNASSENLKSFKA